MKKYFLILMVILLGLAGMAHAEFSAVFSDTFTLPIRRWSPIIPMGEDGLFVVGGSDEEGSGVPTAVWLDHNGNEISRLPLAETADGVRQIAPLAGGAFAMYRDLPTAEATDREVIIVSDGEVVYREAIENNNKVVWPLIFPAKDGFFLEYGESSRKDKHGGTFHVSMIEKKSNSGETEWSYVFSEHELQFTGTIAAEGGHVLFGGMEEQGTGKRHNVGVIAKMSDAGELLWIAEGTDYEETFSDAILLPDQSMLVTGSRYERLTGPGISQWAILARYSPEGELLWKKDYHWDGIDAFGFGEIQPLPDGYLILAEEIDFMPPLHLLRVDDGGEVLDHWVIDAIEGRKYDMVTLCQIAGSYHVLVETTDADFTDKACCWIATGLEAP